MGNSRSSRRNKTGPKITTQNARMNSVTQNTVCQSLSAPPVENPLPLSPLPSVPLPPTKKDRRPVNPVARSVQSRVPVWRNAHGDMISITTSHPIESTNDSSSDSSPRLTHNATPVHEHHRNPSPDHHHYHNQHATDLFSHHHHSDPLTSSQPSYTSTYSDPISSYQLDPSFYSYQPDTSPFTPPDTSYSYQPDMSSFSQPDTSSSSIF